MFKCTCMIIDARLYLWIPQMWPIPSVSPDFITKVMALLWFAKYTPTLLGKLASLPDPNLKGHTYKGR